MNRMIYVYMDREKPGTIIDVNNITKEVHIVNLSDDMITRAFGVNENPNFEDFEEFLESRCMPRTRYGIKEELSRLGIDTYDPYRIIEKTMGRVYGDGQWLFKADVEWKAGYDAIMSRHLEEDRLRKALTDFIASTKPEH